MNKTLSIIIPVHNEEATLLEIFGKIMLAPLSIEKEIIFVENGSTDNTVKILKDIKKRWKVIVEYLPKNVKGKSVAVRKGIEKAKGDIIIIQDADLEYDPNDYQKLINPILKGEASIVYGSRRLNKRNKKHSHFMFYLGGNLLTIAANFLYPGLNITDEATCYKVFKTDVIKSFPLKSKRFEFCPEVTAWAYKKGYKIKELPIQYYPRSKDEGKKIIWADGVEALWVLLKHSDYVWELLKYILTVVIIIIYANLLNNKINDLLLILSIFIIWFLLLRQFVFMRR